jgi:glycosyltransferase involved in cell wall biosynthesis
MQKILPMFVLIATHNRNSLLERTIESLNGCILPEHRSVKLIVVENGGRYGAEDVVRRNQSNLDPEYRYFEMGNKSAALNFVISSLPDSIIIFLDDDVRVEPSFLVHYSRAIGSKTGGFFFGGGLLVDYELSPPKWLIDFLPISAQGWHPKEHAPMGDLYFFGANWAAFTHDILMLDGFDLNYGPGGLSGGTGQETAMQKKFIKNNIKYIYI